MVNAESKVKAAQTAPNDSSTMAESCYGVPVSPQKWITVVRRWESPRNVWRDRRGRAAVTAMVRIGLVTSVLTATGCESRR